MTPDPVQALRVALELSRYAAAPFFREAERRRDDDGEAYYVQPTTEEWWAGLKELIEKAQPLLEAAIAAAPQAAPSVQPDVRITDDDTLRYACRVLSAGSHPPEEDRKRAKDMLMAIRTRIREPAASSPQASPPQPSEPDYNEEEGYEKRLRKYTRQGLIDECVRLWHAERGLAAASPPEAAAVPRQMRVDEALLLARAALNRHRLGQLALDETDDALSAIDKALAAPPHQAQGGPT